MEKYDEILTWIRDPNTHKKVMRREPLLLKSQGRQYIRILKQFWKRHFSAKNYKKKSLQNHLKTED